MRCSCPMCGAFMIHAESAPACVCPDCLYRCSACLGTGTALSREEVGMLRSSGTDNSHDDRSVDANGERQS